MKRHWFTIAAAALLAGLVGYLYLVEFPTEEAKTRKDQEEKRLLALDQRDITQLSIVTPNEQITLAPGEKGSWKVTRPVLAEADSREVDALLRALVLGKITRVVEEQSSALEPFGLEKPSVVITLSGNGKTETLSIGDIGPISSTLYVMRESDKKVLLTDLAAKDFLNKRLFTFRKKDLLRFDQSAAERLRLTYGTTDIVLYRTDDLDQTRRNKWKIRSPIEAPADVTEVRMYLTRLEDLKALGFIDPGAERDTLASHLKEPTAKIAVYAGGTDHTVTFYQPDASRGEAYAVTANEAPIYRVSPAVIKDLMKDLFALQDKRLLGVEVDEIALLSVKTRDQQYQLVNQTGTWVLESKPEDKLDQQKADLFVSRIVNLPAELQVVKQAGPLAPYGLSAPAAEFTATAKDGTIKGRLVLGSKSGGLLYAMGQRLPGIYQVRADILTQISTAEELISRPPGPQPASP